MTGKPPGVRVAQAIMFLSGALALNLAVVPDGRRFYWTPLVVGLAYLAAAVAGGRRGGHWATACVLVGWGAAMVFAGAARPDLDIAGLYMVGAGLGAVAGLLLRRAGVYADPLGLAVVITASGLLLTFAAQAPSVLEEARTYAALLALVAVANLALAARDWGAEPREGST
ncbi:MAG: hypothetical protein ACRDPC_17500 [Solirubrobacteraceae bacterium]